MLSQPRLEFFARLGLFFFLSGLLLFFNYSLELSEPLKPVVSFVFYAVEFALIFSHLARKKLGRALSEYTPPAPRHSLVLGLFALAAFGVRLALSGQALWRVPFSAIGLFLLLASLLGFKALRQTASAFRRELLISAAFFGFLTLLWNTFYTHWLYLGTFTATVVAKLLDATFGNAVLDLSNPELPVVGRQPFVAVIYPECSGIQSLILFTALFILAWAVDFQEIDKRKAFAAYLLGMTGMFIVTVLRIYFIIAAGVLFSVNFAIQFVHSTISLVLFVLYFAAFWRLALRRIRKRP